MGPSLWLAERRDRHATPAPSYAALSFSGDPSSFTSTSSSSRPQYELRRDPEHSPGRVTIDEIGLLYAGDQVFIRREVYGAPWDWISAVAIRIASTTGTDKGPTIVNHVATIVRPIREVDVVGEDGILISYGPIVDYMIAEALPSGFKFRPLLENYGDERRYSFAVARHKLAIQVHREKIVAACDHLDGKSYGYLKVGAHGLDYALTVAWNMAGGRGDVYAARWLCRMERYPMCSWASLYEYEKAGLPFSTPVETGSPDDLWDECRRKALAIWIWPFYSRKIRSRLLGPGFGEAGWRRRRL